jgi:hypothetical protein
VQYFFFHLMPWPYLPDHFGANIQAQPAAG